MEKSRKYAGLLNINVSIFVGQPFDLVDDKNKRNSKLLMVLKAR